MIKEERAANRARYGQFAWVTTLHILPGASFVTSSAELRWLKVREPSESLEVYARPGLVRAVAAELDGSGSPALPDVGGVDDPVVWSVAASFRAALLGGRAMTELEADTRFRLLLRHVLVTYGGLPGNGTARGRLDARRLSRVQRAPEQYERDMVLRELPFEEALEAALGGFIEHAGTIAALVRAARALGKL